MDSRLNGSAGHANKAPLSTAMSQARPAAPTDVGAAERRQATRVMAERMKQLVDEQMTRADDMDAALTELRRELGETRQRLAETEARAAREKSAAEAAIARLEQDVQTLEAENARTTRELASERETNADLTGRLRQIASISTSKTA